MTYKISVIVPIYNQEKYLNKAIESVINQTIGFENIELILVDDCSTDDSKSIIENYSQKYKNVIPIYLETNSGSAAIPRNHGLKKVNAPYIMFLDPDDKFILDFCETMYENITKNKVDLVKCNFITITNDTEHYTPYFDEKIKEKLIKKTDPPLKYVSICNGIHKTDILQKNKIIFPNCIGEDICFTTNEFLNINQMLFLNNYFGYKYYDIDESHAKEPNTEKILSVIKAFKITKQYCDKSNREDVLNIILGQQLIGLFTRINANQESITIKRNLLKKTYDLRKTMPNLIIPSVVYKIADNLMMKKLFYITIIYLKIAPKIYNSKIILKILK